MNPILARAMLVLGASVAIIAIATPYRYGSWLDPTAVLGIGGITLNYGTGFVSALLHIAKVIFVYAFVPAWRRSRWAGGVCVAVCAPLVALSVWTAMDRYETN